MSLLFVVLLVLGDLVRRNVLARRPLAEQAARSELEQARRAVLEERTRIAREMHDVVAHHMSMIAVQAETAPYRVGALPDAARTEFLDIAGSAREALTEMRRLLGVLRSDAGPAATAPQPGMADVSDLVAATERAGLFQTLGLFFFAAGHAAARSLARFPGSPPRWLLRRLGRLVPPAVALLGVGAAVLLVAIVLGVPDDTLEVAVTLTVSPIWFLLPLVALSALTAPLLAAVRRDLVVAGTDLAVRLPAGSPGLLPVAVTAAWSVPYLIGLAHAEGRLAGRRPALTLAVVGAVALAALIAGGYPVSAVGVPGRSNLSPPSLFAIALAALQIGVWLSARPVLLRLLDRPGAAGLVRRVNRHAMRIYLCHQPVLVGVSALAARFAGPLPGLHTPPDGPGWVAARLCWLPVLALVLAVLVRSGRGSVEVTRGGSPERRPGLGGCGAGPLSALQPGGSRPMAGSETVAGAVDRTARGEPVGRVRAPRGPGVR